MGIYDGIDKGLLRYIFYMLFNETVEELL